MKGSILSIFTAITLSFSACSGNAQNNSSDQNEQQTIIQVIDFHSTHRCVTCLSIEKQAKAALDKYYNAEMTSGLIIFKTVNVDEDENYAIAEEFEAAGTALFINVLKNGQSTKIDLTDFAFMNARSDDDSFERGFKSEMDKAVNLL